MSEESVTVCLLQRVWRGALSKGMKGATVNRDSVARPVGWLWSGKRMQGFL